MAVGAEVFVAVAAGDLVVALHARHHQQLLEQLRALRQRVERAGLQPGGHHEVTRAFRGGPRERRGFDLDEIVAGQHCPCGRIHLGAQPNYPTGSLAAQVEVAVFQPRLLPRGLVELEWQRRTFAEDGQRGGVDFYVAGGDFGVRVAFGPDLDDTLHGDAEFGAQPVRLLEHVALTEHHLRHSGRVAQVDEDDAAVVAPTRNPARQRHLLTGVGGPQRTCGVGAQHKRLLSGSG